MAELAWHRASSDACRACGAAHRAPPCPVQQVLGRNLEGTITKAEGIKKEWKDDFTSVEHLVLAMLDDPRFGRKLLRDAGLDATKLTQAIKDIRGGSRVQDQASPPWPALSPQGARHCSSLHN